MSELTYWQAVRALQSRGRFGVRLGLGRTRAILRELGNPERSFRGALIGGTNGKGSVLALDGSAIRAAGLRVGETPKPHLVSYRERLQIDGRLVDPETFAELVAEVLEVADRVAGRHGDPTEFEVLTGVAYLWFAQQRVDLALVEVGLGGRLDATHAWNGGVAAITNVDLDHTEWLGSTIAEIAREKAAIIERGDRAVTGATGAGLAVIRRRARRLGVPLVEVRPPPVKAVERRGIVVELAELGEVRVSLRGRHQAANVAVADAVLDSLETAGIAHVNEDQRRMGYATAHWPGRLELLEVPVGDGEKQRTRREVLLDGAHNPAGAAVLAQALDDLRPFLVGGADGLDGVARSDRAAHRATGPSRSAPITLLTASMADKDVDGMIRALRQSDAMAGAHIVCTSLDVPRALPAADLAARWAAALGPGAIQPIVEPRVPVALERALAEATGPVVVAGSLYLVGEVRRRLVDDPQLRDPEDDDSA